MGWWRASREGASLQMEETGLAWGDGPADTMDDALQDITQQFRDAYGRLPTRAELRAGLEFSLGGGSDASQYDPDNPTEEIW